MFRKSISVLLLVVMVLSCSSLAFATTPQTSSSETIHFQDGSYATITTCISPSLTRVSSKDADKTYKHYGSDGKLAWSFTIYGTFTYNNSTAKATAASCSSSINTTGWTCTSKSARCSGASVIGDATFKYNGAPQTISLTLTCSPTGSIK